MRRETWVTWISFLALTTLVVGVLLWLAGCAMVLTEATRPEVREMVVATPPDVTYARALRAAQTMGGTLKTSEPLAHTFTTEVNQAVGLYVDIRRGETGTKMTVTGMILPRQLAVGPFRVADDFLVAYQREAH
jgi:hypothetical protein